MSTFLSRRISATPKKLTFISTYETCRETMAQIQQNIILKKCMWLTLGEIIQVLRQLNIMPNRSLSIKTACQYRPSEGFNKQRMATAKPRQAAPLFYTRSA